MDFYTVDTVLYMTVRIRKEPLTMKSRPAMLALGSVIAFATASAAPVAATPTFTKDVAPILQEKCQDCHREGAMAPMSLITYEQTRPWAKSIKQRVLARQMPPWFIDKTVGIQHFANDASLSDQQMATIVKWVDAGAPMGNPKDMPAAKVYNDDNGWVLAKKYGQPDIVLKSDDYTMPAHGQDVWFKPYTDVNITEPRWVRAVEMRPGTWPAGGSCITRWCGRSRKNRTRVPIIAARSMPMATIRLRAAAVERTTPAC